MHVRAVRNGKLYDTDTAERVSGYWNGKNDKHSQEPNEFLYKTKKGNYFLVIGDDTITEVFCGEFKWNVRPVSVRHARAWCEHNCDVETVQKFFTVEEA